MLLSQRLYHSSCAIYADDGSLHCVIIIGGRTPEENFYSKSTEILNIKDNKWTKGPTLPCDVRNAACVSLPPIAKFACVIVGGKTFLKSSANVYGLNKTLSEWTALGKIRKERKDYITLPLS